MKQQRNRDIQLTGSGSESLVREAVSTSREIKSEQLPLWLIFIPSKTQYSIVFFKDSSSSTKYLHRLHCVKA